MAKARSSFDFSLDFGTARSVPVPPEDLRLSAGSYGVNISVMCLAARPRRALKVKQKTHLLAPG